MPWSFVLRARKWTIDISSHNRNEFDACQGYEVLSRNNVNTPLVLLFRRLRCARAALYKSKDKRDGFELGWTATIQPRGVVKASKSNGSRL